MTATAVSPSPSASAVNGSRSAGTSKGSASPFSLRNAVELLRGRIPGQLIIQLTDACNARCPQCEMRVTNRYQRSHLQDQPILRSIDAAAEQGVAALSFTGGEPFLDIDRLVRLLRHASDAGIPLLRTGTNGYFLRFPDRADFESKVEDLASQLAETRLRNLWFSIDSASTEVHEEMRGMKGVIRGMEKALPIFERYGIYPTANLGINRNTGTERLGMEPNPSQQQKDDFYGQCLESFESFYGKVVDMGFTIVNFCYPMSVESEPSTGLEAVYRASSADDIVSFRQDEKVLLFAAMSEAVRRWRHRIRIFSPRNMLYSLVRTYETGEEHGYACRGGVDFFFLSAHDGNTYPCGFRADENMGKFWQLDRKSLGKDATCTKCDWECFRDPSNLAGPALDLPRRPLSLAKRLTGDREWTRLWLTDLRYQRATDYCDGRKAPNLERLSRFAPIGN